MLKPSSSDGSWYFPLHRGSVPLVRTSSVPTTALVSEGPAKKFNLVASAHAPVSVTVCACRRHIRFPRNPAAVTYPYGQRSRNAKLRCRQIFCVKPAVCWYDIETAGNIFSPHSIQHYPSLSVRGVGEEDAISVSCESLSCYHGVVQASRRQCHQNAIRRGVC